MNYKILWSDEAVKNLEQILNYLSSEWTEREVTHFKSKLLEQLTIISRFPNAFPASNIIPRLRKAVLTKQTIIFYEVKDKSIYIAYLFDSRQSTEKSK